MKKFIVLLLVLFILPFGACASNKDGSIDIPPVEVLPLPDDGATEEDDSDAERKKKTYLVSTVNSLRVRSSTSNNSAVLGYLDKNDTVMCVEKVGKYYKTVFKEKTAFVYADYCTIMEIDSAENSVENAIDLGSSLLGHPYVWGSQRYHWGNGVLNKNFVDGEFDCSALVQYIYYKSNNVILDVTSRAQSYNGVEVKKSELQRGDLMFFTNASRKNKTGEERIGHVGIYFGNNYILHTASDHAVIEPISALRWSYYLTARRVA